ncbi:glycosyltransferase [Empedobacter sp. ULE_I140]
MAIKAFTIISENYLPQAKTLADNFIQLHPNIEFYICLFGEKENEEFHQINSDLFSGYKYILSNKLNQGDYTIMRSQYDNFSMACALKPFFAEFILEKDQPNGLIYLDADLYFFSPLADVQTLLNNNEQQSSIILTPHNILINEFNKEIERNISFLTYGTFNAGFFAIKNNQYSKQFIDWWKRMLKEYCIVDLQRGLYCDQTWLNLVPVLFTDSLYTLKHLGYNVAYWNVDVERKISITQQGRFMVNDNVELVFYHFARFDFNDDKIEKLGLKSSETILKQINQIYRKKLLFNNYLPKQVELVEDKKQHSKLFNLKETVKWKLIRILKNL